MFRDFNLIKLKKRLLRKIGYQKVVPDAITREDFFDLYFAMKRPFVVQIGTNDGKTHDPIHSYITKYRLPGLLVEPQEDIFERLKDNYKDNENLKFANVAIGAEDGEVPFYRIKPSLVVEGMEYKASSGSSFFREQIVANIINRLPPRRSNVLKHVSDNPEDYIEEVRVRVVTLDSLFREYGIGTVDFLLTDCQGFDYAVLKQLDFNRFSPDIINFEHCLLTPEELTNSRALLNEHGYKYFINEGDTCAYKA